MSGGRRLAAVAVVVVAMSGCSMFRSRPASVPAPPPVERGVQVGVASWYGPRFHGRPTASGEIFNQHALTAAHPTLALGTRARVTSLTNDRSVDVRINDRGPFVGGRIVDLSRAAAERLRMIAPGVMRVRLEVLDEPDERPVVAARRKTTPLVHRRRTTERRAVEPPDESPPAVPASHDGEDGWVVQCAAFPARASAEEAHRQIVRRFPDAYVAPVGGDAADSFGVRLGPYEARRSAEARAAIVHHMGYSADVLRLQRP